MLDKLEALALSATESTVRVRWLDLLKLVAAIRAAKDVAMPDAFYAAYHDKMAALRAALEELEGKP